MIKGFRMFGITNHPLTTHCDWWNCTPEGGLQVPMAPTIWVPFPPWKRTNHPYGNQILVLQEHQYAVKLNAAIDIPHQVPAPQTPLTLGNPHHVVEGTIHRVVLICPSWDTPRVAIRKYHCLTHPGDFLDHTDWDHHSQWSSILQVLRI